MSPINIYQEFLSCCSPVTEDEIEVIEQLDYQGYKFNDFNAPVKTYSVEEWKMVSNKMFNIEDFPTVADTSTLNPFVKVYARFKDGNGMAFELLKGSSGFLITRSFIPKLF